MKQLFTPPINNINFDTYQSVKESYENGSDDYKSEDHSKEKNPGASERTSERLPRLSSDEIQDCLDSITKLPPDISHMVETFVTDLKQPKYVRPLSVIQLSSLFQAFYIKVDKACFQLLSDTLTNNSSPISNARESLSTGLSGIFARSRSSSYTTMGMKGTRSSSLFSNDSRGGTQMLSPEEIEKQLKTNELNNCKIDKYMNLCEKKIFQRLYEVGTAVASPSKKGGVTSKIKNQSNNHEYFNIVNLFRNTPEFLDYDTLLNEKIKHLSKLSLDGKINLGEFLGIPDFINFDHENSYEEIKKIWRIFSIEAIAPYEKLEKLLKLHELMMESKAKSNDEFLSMLIYYIIRVRPKNIFLNFQFISLFRYKRKLVQNELYALTNLEAALTFIEGLTLNDFSDEFQRELGDKERDLFERNISKRVVLPIINESSTNTINNALPRGRSYDGFKSAFDSSLRNIIGKISSYTPPTAGTLELLPLPRSGSQLSIDFDKTLTKESTNNSLQSINKPASSLNLLQADDVPNQLKKYKDKHFEELRIDEMREIFEIYKKLVE